MIDIFGFLKGAIEPVTKLVGELHTSDEEKMSLNNKMIELQNAISFKLLDYETKLMEKQADVIQAEATGQSTLQRNWRPITMLTFLFLVVMDSFGFLPFRLADEAWMLLQIGLGGYVVGRSLEKSAPHIAKVVKK